MNQAKVKSALITAYKNGGFFSDANTRWENSTFTPPNATPWAAVSYIPAQPDVATLGDDGEDEVRGIFQIDLNYPVNSGTQASEQKADSIAQLFKAGERFTYSGQQVVIRSCGRSASYVADSWWRTNISVSFYARMNR